MTASNNQPQNSPLKVVPPKAVGKAPTVTPQPAPTAPATPSQKPASSKSYGKWLMIIVLLLGGTAIAQMRIPNYVRGEGEITSRIEARQRITMPVSGTVQLKVKSHQPVTAGDTVAVISSPDLDNQIAEAERILQQANPRISMAKNQLKSAEKRLVEAEINEAIALERSEKQRRENEAIISGEKLPRIRQIEREMEGVESEIAGIRNEIEGVESQIAGIQEEIEAIAIDRAGMTQQLNKVEEGLLKRQELVEEGAIASYGREMMDLQMQQLNLQSQIQQRTLQIDGKRQQINQTESEIRQRENLIDQKYRLIEAQTEQIKEIEKQVKDLLGDRENEVEQQVAARRSAETEVAAAKTAVDSEMQQLNQAEAELKRLRDRKNELRLTTTTTGTVLTSDLDLMNNTTLSFGEEILQIVDLAQLTATVQIPQEDGNLVKLNQPVVFTLRDPYSPKYKATVTEILPKIVVDESGSNPMLTVQILIDNQNNSLLPGSEGFAHIATGEMRVYEKVKHEFDKLFELNKYFPGFLDNPE